MRPIATMPPNFSPICKADMLIKGQDVSKIRLGNTLSDDQLAGLFFDYMLSNPPFGVDWKKIQKIINDEHTQKGYAGRFGPGLPRVSDGSLLFLLHLVSKMRPLEKGQNGTMQGGSRIGITEPSDAVGDFHAMRPNRLTHTRFLLYQILSKEFIVMVDGSTFGSKMPRASWEFVGKMPLPLPPLPEQHQIASFLAPENTGSIITLTFCGHPMTYLYFGHS